MKLFFRQWIESVLNLSRNPLKQIQITKNNSSFQELAPHWHSHVHDKNLSFIIASSGFASSLKTGKIRSGIRIIKIIMS